MTVTCTETAECDKWAEIVALAQQGNKKMLGVILQAFDIKLRKIAHTSAYKGFAEDGEQIERVAVVKALEKWGQRQDFEKLPAFIVSKSYTALSSEWKRRHKDEEMTCPYEIESGCEFAEEVLTADAAQTTRTYFEQQQLQQDFAEVQELLVQLSPKQEELIELHFLEGWSNGELAQRFGVSPAAISKTIKKGLGRLRAQFIDKWAEEFAGENDTEWNIAVVIMTSRRREPNMYNMKKALREARGIRRERILNKKRRESENDQVNTTNAQKRALQKQGSSNLQPTPKTPYEIAQEALLKYESRERKFG